jgi:hypothetical protein
MATIYFKKVNVIDGDYWSLKGFRRASKEEDLNGLSILFQEYQIVCGDIAVDNRTQSEALKKLRDEMERDGHTVILENQPQP